MKRNITYTLSTIVLVVVTVSSAEAQVTREFLPAGPADWYEPSNWTDSLVPSREFSEIGAIHSNRFAFVDSDRADTVFDGVDANPGQVQIAVQGALGPGSILEIRDQGTFRVALQTGDNTTGGVDVGSPNGTGILRVLPGGSMTIDQQLGVSFTALPNPPSQVVVGDPAAGLGSVATLEANSGSINGVLQPLANSDLNFLDVLNFADAATFRPEIRSTANAKVDVTNGASLDGVMTLDFNGFTPTVGQTWTVMEAATIGGNFTAVNSPNIGIGEVLVPAQVPTGGGRERLDVTYSTSLVLMVNRDTGEVSLSNPNSPDILADGYSIRSDIGHLNPADGVWNSLDDGDLLGGDWRESNVSANNLAELKPTGSGTFSGNNEIVLGNVYDPLAGAFATGEDLVFDYTTEDGSVIPGQIVYTGTTVNNLLLQVDPSSGDAELRNTSATTVLIDGYDILSDSGSLLPADGDWLSLEDQGIDSGDWTESNVSANRLSELKPDGSTTLSPGDSLDLGHIFDAASGSSLQDLVFNFLQVGNSTPTQGVVLYEPLAAGFSADFDGDGDVDGDDLDQWEGDFANNGNSDANGDGDSDGADFLAWQRQFGSGVSPLSGGAVTAVPEPGALLLSMLAMGIVSFSSRPLLKRQWKN